jgi:hypothetical protein
MTQKSEIRPYIARCTKCGLKSVLMLKKVNKTATSYKPCKNCSRKDEKHDIRGTLVKRGTQIKAIHRIIGKVTRKGKKALKIKWF